MGGSSLGVTAKTGSSMMKFILPPTKIFGPRKKIWTPFIFIEETKMTVCPL